MNLKQFDKWLFEKFIEWEKTQPRKRSSYAKFAAYLSGNELKIEISPQVLNGWINGKYKPDAKYIPALVEKLGEETFDILDLPRPDHRLRDIQVRYETIPDPLKDTYYTDFQKWWDDWFKSMGAHRQDKPK